MKTSLRYLLQGWLAVVPAFAFAIEPTHMACPTVVSAMTIQVARPSPDWAARPSGDFRLYAAGFNDGPPEKLAELKPTSVVDKGKQSVETWEFDEDSFVDGLWMVCGYGGAAGEITLARKLPNGYRSCSVSYRPSPKAGARVLEITCR